MRGSHALNGTRGLVVVTRAPGSDGAKTRLAEAVGADACLRLQAAFLADTIAWAGGLAGRQVLSVYPPARARDVADEADGWLVAPQVGADFGERMRGAVNAGFAAGAAPVAMIASDSPTLPPEVLEEGWALVQEGRFDVALGPADDGGWVMIAAARPLPPGCFDGVHWSVPETLGDTRRALSAAGLRVGGTRPWYDVDTAEDLKRLHAELGAGAAGRLPRTAAAMKPFPE
jgi:rSAM/selenodomain-associated transferase 1